MDNVGGQPLQQLGDCREAAQIRLGPHVHRAQKATGLFGAEDGGRPGDRNLGAARPGRQLAGEAHGEVSGPAPILGQQEDYLHGPPPWRYDARSLITSRGPRTLRPPLTAARYVASENPAIKPRGIRSAAVVGRHHPGRLVTADVKPAAATAATTRSSINPVG